MKKADKCKGTIEKKWAGHGMSVLWRRGCRAKTLHESGYCHNHRTSHTTLRN